MNQLTLAGGLTALMALGACNGSTGSATVAPAPGLQDMANTAFGIVGEAQTLGRSTTLPASGSATYDGALFFDVDPATNAAIVGPATATVDFASTTLSGSASGFVSGTIDGTGTVTTVDGPVAGAIALSASSFGAASNFDVAATGTLEVGGAVQSVDGTITSTFYGDGSGGPVGIVGSGDLTLSGSSSALPAGLSLRD